MGYGPEDTNFCLELTENYDKDSYDLGTGFGHFALALPDVYKTCESIKKAGEFHACIVMITNVTTAAAMMMPELHTCRLCSCICALFLRVPCHNRKLRL